MKALLKLTLTLTIISFAAGLLLAYTHKVTAPSIAAAVRQETIAALASVLPPFDNDPSTTTLSISESGRPWVFHVARKNGAFVGSAFETSSKNGYGGDIRIMVGITADGHLKSIHFLAQHETPGLGTKIDGAPFKLQFAGKPVAGPVWNIKKDQGHFDAITGATISSRAVLEAIRNGIDAYTAHASEIARTGE
jgi:electron transport complex protein RnfG